MLGLNTFLKKKNFHLILFFLFFICLKQIYLFSNQDCYENNNLIFLCKNTFLSIKTIFSTNLDLSTNLDISKSNLFVLKKIQQNNGVFLDDLNKIIFEKKVIFTKSNFLELYNYNLQMFLNANTLVIFFLFIFFLFIFFLFIFSRKKKTLY